MSPIMEIVFLWHLNDVVVLHALLAIHRVMTR